MQPSKSKNTRYQPKALYLAAALLFCASAVVTTSMEYDLPWINTAIALLPSHNYVHWRTRDEAWQECKKTHKPILYFILGKKDGSSMMLEGQCFGDPRVAELIESDFIPVQYWFDRKNKGYETDPDFKYYRDKMQLNCDGNPCIACVPFSLHDAPASDLISSANLVELGIDDSSRLKDDAPYFQGSYGYYGNYGSYGCGGGYRNRYGNFGAHTNGCIQYGYTNEQEFLDYLYAARLFHKLPPTVGRINWLPVAKLNLNHKGAKPRLLALVQDVGAQSDNMRLNLFWKNKSVKVINEKFEPYLIEFHRNDPAYNKQFKDLRKKYGIKQLPALIVLDCPGRSANDPPVERGFVNMQSSVDFLLWSLKPGAKQADHWSPVRVDEGGGDSESEPDTSGEND